MTKITEEENSVEIETDAKHITIHTRNGEINLFMGEQPQDNHIIRKRCEVHDLVRQQPEEGIKVQESRWRTNGYTER